MDQLRICRSASSDGSFNLLLAGRDTYRPARLRNVHPRMDAETEAGCFAKAPVKSRPSQPLHQQATEAVWTRIAPNNTPQTLLSWWEESLQGNKKEHGGSGFAHDNAKKLSTPTRTPHPRDPRGQLFSIELERRFQLRPWAAGPGDYSTTPPVAQTTRAPRTKCQDLGGTIPL